MFCFLHGIQKIKGNSIWFDAPHKFGALGSRPYSIAMSTQDSKPLAIYGGGVYLTTVDPPT